MTENKYRLLQDYVHPCGKTYKGTVNTVSEWLRRFISLDSEQDLKVKDDWFELVTEPSIVPERIEVVSVNYNVDGSYYWFRTKDFVFVEDFHKLKPIIENALNDTVVDENIGAFYWRNKYDKLQSEVDAIKCELWCAGKHGKQKTYTEYLESISATLPLQQVQEDKNMSTVYFDKQVLNPYPTGSQSYTAWEKGFTEAANKYFNPQPSITVKDKQEWEIVCFKHSSSETYFNLRDGKYFAERFGDEEFTIDDLLHNKNGKTYNIFSVLRKSDNTVFSHLQRDGDGNLITGFHTLGRHMMVELDYGSVSKNIIYLTKPNTDTISSKPVIDEDAFKNRCNVCGGDLVYIRGKFPNTDKRLTCPTCTTERLEQINEISGKDYGKAYQS